MTPILFVPGLLCTAEAFAAQARALWPFGSVTCANTLEGETMAQIAAAILRDAPPRFALCGISMGGYICFEILRQAPERVLKLALLDTSARPDRPEQTEQRRALVARARSSDFEALIAEVLTAILHPARREDPALREINVRMGLSVGLEGMARQQAAIIARPDSRPSLTAISVPTLVLVGDCDPLTPPEQAEEMAAAIAHSRLVVVPECGHASTLEQPDAVSQALLEWIQS